MAGPNYGALGATFKVVRMLQAVSLLAIIGMTANFISEMVSSSTSPPNVLVGTLSVTCIAVLYCAITYILFVDGILPFLINTGLDGLLLIAVVVVAVAVGKPLSYLDCQVIGETTGNAYAFTAALGSSLDKSGGMSNYNNWIGATKTTCFEMKSIWGLSIALW
ncbi:MAG: hypothetical protein M1830_000207 [Pleopsidium flavum]|nr:MAG: hypothetical protein M1830_000207 [Pleopsidium flavum]